MNAKAQLEARPVRPAREEQIRRALFRGDNLVLENPRYLRAVQTFLDELLVSDAGAGDLTVQALAWRPDGPAAEFWPRSRGLSRGSPNVAGF